MSSNVIPKHIVDKVITYFESGEAGLKKDSPKDPTD